jgi:hypothetical protein
MVFNIVRVVRVEPGAMLGDTVFDQWLHIEFGGSTASVFDSEMIAPEYASGEIHELKLSLMATSVEPSNSSARGVSGNWYYGKVVSVYRRESLYDHVLDINGLKIHLLEDKEHPVGVYLSVRGRLDLDDIKYPHAESWTTV